MAQAKKGGKGGGGGGGDAEEKKGGKGGDKGGGDVDLVKVEKEAKADAVRGCTCIDDVCRFDAWAGSQCLEPWVGPIDGSRLKGQN